MELVENMNIGSVVDEKNKIIAFASVNFFDFLMCSNAKNKSII